jgi:glycosyltransferase involved in cell wall biosynthesis
MIFKNIINKNIIYYMKSIGLIYRKEAYKIPTIYENINCIIKNLYDFNIYLIPEEDINLIFDNSFDILIIHNTSIHSFALGLNYLENNKFFKNNNEINLDSMYHLSKMLLIFMKFIKNFNGIKLAICQDEYYNTIYIENFLFSININIVLTVSPLSEIKKIYPLLNNTTFVNVLTGYFNDDEEIDNIPSIKDRHNYVFYRGRRLHYSYGDLGQDKEKIGIYMKEICNNNNLTNDISVNPDDCIYSNEWYNYLKSSKTTLATDSGSNIYDRDNSIRKKINNILNINSDLSILPNEVIYDYNYIYNYFINDFNNKFIEQGQISPKMFEAIKLKTVLIMFEGRYSEILKPNIHYIELKKDFSNISFVLEKLNDDEYLQNMADKAYNEIYKSKKYNYKIFTDIIIENINNNFVLKPNYVYKNKNSMNNLIDKIYKQNSIVLLRNEGYGYDPRRDSWYESNLDKNYKFIHQCIGENRYKNETYNNVFNINYNYSSIKNDSLINYVFLKFKKLNLNSKCNKIIDSIKILLKSHEDYMSKNNEFENLISFYTLFFSYLHIKNFINNRYNCKKIIIINLPLLIAGILIKHQFNIPIFYDQLEYWAHSQNRFIEEETLIWNEYEKKLLEYIDKNDYLNTVSEKMANYMSELLQIKFNFIPNCVPKSISSKYNIKLNIDSNNCIFLLQGGLSPNRGIEDLISIWDKTNKNAYLHLRGPIKINYLEYLKELCGSLLNQRIFFLDILESFNLLDGINNCDVGIIPYGYSDLNINHRYCSPNKMGEYLSLSKPILANFTENISYIISKGKCGIVVDFKNQNLLINSINKLTLKKKFRYKISKNANKFYNNYFNWDYHSKNFYSFLYN